MQASGIVQGLERPDYYEQLTQLRNIMADKKMSLWIEEEAAISDSGEATPDMQFLFSLLEALYNDRISDVAKCHLLMLIEEHFDAFVTSPSSASELVNSLLSVLSIGSHGRDRKDLATPNHHGFVLQCVTAIVVRFELLETEPEMCERIVQQLLDATSLVSSGNPHLRFRAIASLEQLELRFPTFLMWKLEHLHQICVVDFSFLFEHALRLFCLALRHAVDLCTMESARWRPELFELRTESLRHCSLPFDTIARLRRFQRNCAASRCLADDSGQLQQHIHYCLDRAKFLSCWSLVAVLEALMHVVARFSTLSPSLFKSVTLRLLPIARPRLLFCLLHQRALFTDALYAGHSGALLATCLNHVNNARNGIPHRLLAALWLCENVRLVEDQRAAISDLRVLQPSVFDPLDVKYAKLLFLNSFLDLRDERAAALLLASTIGVRKLTQYAGPGKVTAALYQILLQLYRRRSGSPLAKDIFRLVMGITKENPALAPYTLDFAAAVQTFLPGDPLPRRAAAELSDWACAALPDVLEGPAALHHLRLAAWAVRDPAVEPGPVVQVLLRHTELCFEAGWAKGHACLDVCRSLLECRGAQAAGSLFPSLGDLLATLSLRHGHLDVRQRAELYYSLLLHLSGPRLQGLLGDSRQAAAGAVEVALRRTEGYPVLAAVRWMEEEAFQVRLVPAWGPEARVVAGEVLPAVWDAEASAAAPGGPLLAGYLQFVRAEVTRLPLVLSLSDPPCALFGLEFSLQSCPAGADLRLLTPSCAVLAPGQSRMLCAELHAARADHLRLRLSATFACEDREPCLGEAAPLHLRLLDLLLPLPVASRHLQRLIANELRAADLLRSFMTLQPSAEQRQSLLDALLHLQLGEGQYCGLLLPDSHVLIEIEDRDQFCFVTIFTDRASALKHIYHFMRTFSTKD